MNQVLLTNKKLHLEFEFRWDSSLLASKDYYSGDTTANGDYDYYVTGILKLSDSNVTSGKQGAVIISNSATDGFLKIQVMLYS